MYYIFSFRSRTAAIRFRDALIKEGIACSVVNTPRAASAGCGLSIKVTDLAKAKRVHSGGYGAHAIFAVTAAGSSLLYTRI